MAQDIDNSFFDKTHISETIVKMSKWAVMGLIKERKHIRFTDLQRLTSWRPTTLLSLIRDLEIIKFLKCETILDENNRQQKVIHFLEDKK